MKDLQSVFALLWSAGLKIKLSKCDFVKQSVKYLGHEVSQHDLRPDPDKVAAILNMEIPINVGKLRSLLGIFSYYRKFVCNYSEIAHPLTQLTKKDASWEWGASQQSAFERLRGSLLVSPVLKYPDFSLRF